MDTVRMETILEMYEGEDVKIDFTLTYSDTWSDDEKAGENVAKADVQEMWFYMKENDTDTEAFMQLHAEDDWSDTTEIEWLGDTDGRVRVHIDSTTEGHAGKNRLYELRLKLTDGSFYTAKKGKIHIYESLIDRP